MYLLWAVHILGCFVSGPEWRVDPVVCVFGYCLYVCRMGTVAVVCICGAPRV